jgi:hypothetical protein
MKCPVIDCGWYDEDVSYDSNCMINGQFQVSKCAIKILCYDQDVLDKLSKFDDDLWLI